jgi:hypothetical protein
MSSLNDFVENAAPLRLAQTPNLVIRWQRTIEETLRSSYPDDDVDYAVGPAFIPGEGGQPMLAMALGISVPAPLLRQRIQGSAALDLATGQEEVERVVRGLIEGVLGQRSKMLSMSQTQQP